MVSMTHTVWIQFKSNDRWLYATTSPESIKIIFNNIIEEKMIKETKILKVKPGCTVISNDVILDSSIDETIDNDNAFIPSITCNFSKHFEVLEGPQLNFIVSLIKLHIVDTSNTKIGNPDNNPNSYGTEIRIKNLHYSKYDFTSSVSNTSQTPQRKAIRKRKENIRKSRIRISEFDDVP
ncbi:hypothetical protein PV326_012215 [Microctonus aethiopoides]|nr:hypothetical protein PV326_012215 [Microctonus aethiopoides]